MALAEHLVGRADELGSFDQLLAQLDGGRSAALELVGEPGIGKTRLLAELAARADARGHLVLSGSATELERDLPFWVFVDALDEYVQGLDPRRLERSTTTSAPSWRRLPIAGGARRRSGGSRSSTSATAAIARCARCSSCSRRPSRVVLVLDDLHWAIQRRSSCWVRCCIGRRPRRCCSRSRVRPRQIRSGCRRRSSGRIGRAALTRLELGALTSGEAASCSGRGGRTRTKPPLYEESGGNPFYLEQLARSLDRCERFAARRCRRVARRRRRFRRRVAAALAEELGCSRKRRAGCSRAPPVAGDPFEPELAAAAAADVSEAAGDRRARSSCCDSTWSARQTCRGGSASGIRSSAARSTRPRPAAGGSGARANRGGARRRAARPPSARAHHVELSARQGDAAAVAVLREAGEAAALSARRQAPRAGSRARCACCPPTRRPRSGSSCCSRVASALAATGQFADSHATLLESMTIVPAECGGAARAADRGVRRRRAPPRPAHEGACPPRDARSPSCAMPASAGGGRADDRARRRRLYRPDYEAMRDWAARAVEAARPLGDRALTAAALGVRAARRRFCGDDRTRRGASRRGGGADRRACRRGARPAA